MSEYQPVYGSVNGDSSKMKQGGAKHAILVAFNVIALSAIVVLLAVVLVKVNKTENDVASMQQQQQGGQSGTGVDDFRVAVPYVTPRETQDFRGTCWDFATVGMLETSYRQFGIKQGFLKPDEYVKFNEQAYGAVVVAECKKNAANQKVCKTPGDNVWNGSTEGGEIPLLYLLPGMGRKLVPASVCPYFPKDGHDATCPGLVHALATNPVSFEIKGMQTFYTVPTIKQYLREKRQVLGISTAVPTLTYYYPCSGEHAADPLCRRGQDEPCAVACPLKQNFATECCVAVTAPSYNMEGDWVWNEHMQVEGGHAMNIVGFNDEYVSANGDVGGFLIKNSWWDGIEPALGPRHARGSHSIQYLMQEISFWDESTICPNSYNPRNWYPCAADATSKPAECVDPLTAEYAKLSNKPLTLQCADATHCTVGADMAYYTKNFTLTGDNMVKMCFWEISNSTVATARDFCLPTMLESLVPYIVQPVAAEVLENDPDQCGFYFMSYEFVRRVWGRFHDSFATAFDVEWSSQSFVAAAAAGYNYTYLHKSTFRQKHNTFSGPFAYEQP